MFLEQLTIEGYKNFSNPFTIHFSKGLNVLVGENGVGKTAIVNAIRLLFLEDEYERAPISEIDFFRPFIEAKERSKAFKVNALFNGLSETEIIAFLPWTNLAGKATLTLLVDNKENIRGRYKRILWGGASRSSAFERELFDKIDCIYLPPLRDAETKLREGKSSRLARLFKNVCKEKLDECKKNNCLHPLVQKTKEFNKALISDDENKTISTINEKIRNGLIQAIGNTFGQETYIQFSEVNFNRIVENLRLFFFPETGIDTSEDIWRSLEENSLGYNNLLYLATVLAELAANDGSISYKVLLIEEPEAHLHPQLQVRLLKYLEKTATQNNIQVIVTTHSPVLASAASLDSLIHLSKHRNADKNFTYTAVALKECGLPDRSKKFITRWLDVTKSTLLFARGIILVEGIAEAMLLSVLAKKVLQDYNNKQKDDNRKLSVSLEDAGISVVNMNGIYFSHFFPLFCKYDELYGENIPVNCAGITDRDPPTTISKDGNKVPSKPTPSSPISDTTNHALELIAKVNKSANVRLYANALKTFEYDLAMEGDNLRIMCSIAKSLVDPGSEAARRFEQYEIDVWNSEKTENDRAEASFYLLTHIEKGAFAQALADSLENSNTTLSIPKYISDAVIWACEGTPNDI